VSDTTMMNKVLLIANKQIIKQQIASFLAMTRKQIKNERHEIQNYLTKITGVDVFALSSFMIFFTSLSLWLYGLSERIRS
jgi:hypothetical protein